MATISPVYGTGMFERDPRAGKQRAKPKGAPAPLPFVILLSTLHRGQDWHIPDNRFWPMVRNAVYELNRHCARLEGIKGRTLPPAFVTTYRVMGDVRTLCVTRCI
jgi:hypothetical protein